MLRVSDAHILFSSVFSLLRGWDAPLAPPPLVPKPLSFEKKNLSWSILPSTLASLESVSQSIFGFELLPIYFKRISYPEASPLHIQAN